MFLSLPWVKNVADISGVPLLCKEGWRGGRNVEQEQVGFTQKIVAKCTTLPHLHPPLTKGRKLDERHFEQSRGTKSYGKFGSTNFPTPF